ncbi:N-ATPase subunit AtpR [Martelella soudanensis]|uniref:N-ATPase subunit AtpR n=1 Tax=unclassified Martelella TaxID=2629616 RepID=UPI0015DDE1AA|nr:MULTISPECIES: ATP synthase subunit I [unclassified Martelella]
MEMIALDWTLLLPGLLAGAGAAGLFLAGLALGIRFALRGSRPALALFVSAALRMAALLGLGWWVAGLGAQALAAFALGFVITRTLVVAVVRATEAREAPTCN